MNTEEVLKTAKKMKELTKQIDEQIEKLNTIIDREQPENDWKRNVKVR